MRQFAHGNRLHRTLVHRDRDGDRNDKDNAYRNEIRSYRCDYIDHVTPIDVEHRIVPPLRAMIHSAAGAGNTSTLVWSRRDSY